MTWTYQEALTWLYNRQALGIKLGLDKVRALLASVGDPQRAFQSIHVAGTNGKGSVTRFLALALQRAGHRVGAFTSPHLVHFTERVEVDGVPIAREDVARLLWVIKPHVEHLDNEDTPPTFFEINTALALLHFKEAGCDWAVVETGMGGRLDATNVLTPAATVITNVSQDHASFLGSNLRDIAYEKAGIIKPDTPCITAATGAALEVIQVQANTTRAPLTVVGEDYDIAPDLGGMLLRTPTGEARYDVGAAGEHQLLNAATAVATADVLDGAIPHHALAASLAEARMPGRLETFLLTRADGGHVEVLLDGAHNLEGARALRRHLGHRDLHSFHLIVGFSDDKPWQEMLGQWQPLALRVHAVSPRGPRGLPSDRIEHAMEGAFNPCSCQPDVKTALQAAIDGGAEAIVVAGSIFLVGEARAILTGQDLEDVHGAQ